MTGEEGADLMPAKLSALNSVSAVLVSASNSSRSTLISVQFSGSRMKTGVQPAGLPLTPLAPAPLLEALLPEPTMVVRGRHSVI